MRNTVSAPLATDPRRKEPLLPDDLDSLVPGDLVQSWEPWIAWDDECESNKTRKSWRQDGDPLCDAALRAMFPSSLNVHGIDLLDDLQTRAARVKRDGVTDDPLNTFLDSVTAEPPESIRATAEEIELAQKCFASNVLPIILSLLHFSLAGGFASPRITRVLRSESYLIPGKSSPGFSSQETQDRTVSRLLETGQFVVDVMGASLIPTHIQHGTSTTLGRTSEPASEPSKTFRNVRYDEQDWRGAGCLTPGKGEGWKSSLRVRLLHGIARRRILERYERSRNSNGKMANSNGTTTTMPLYYDPSTDGAPLNQEDLAHTLAAFSMAPLYCIAKLGYYPKITAAEASATTAFWRHVGFYLGIREDILRKHWRNWERCEKFGWTCGLMLVLELQESQKLAKEQGAEEVAAPTIGILTSFGGVAGFDTPIADRLAISRYLLGSRGSDAVHLPPTSLYTSIRIHLSFFASALPAHFGVAYTWFFPSLGHSWSERRGRLTVEGIARLTRYKLGMRRTAFRPRKLEGGLEDSVKREEEVEGDKEELERFMREWKALWEELIRVSAGVVMIVLIGGSALGWSLWVTTL
ncbi:hypothetical protein FRB98_007936 [Tulasnella sp. 332]|nr:hypothetical protein FRB98_007936 [Tulasnella sp. 332]